MSDDLSKVDWGKPIEAWNPITNETVPMRLDTGAGGDLVTEDCPDPSTSNTWWRQDGANRCVGSPWRIRNVAAGPVQADMGNPITDSDEPTCQDTINALLLAAEARQSITINHKQARVAGYALRMVQEDGYGDPASDDIAKRMEALVRQMAGAGDIRAMTDEARAIVALLPEPVDADLVEARRLAVGFRSGEKIRDEILTGERDSEEAIQALLAAIRRGRALERDSREGVNMLCTAEYFANELNRLRPLTDSELNKLQAVLCGRTPVRRIWTAAEDRELMRLRNTSPHRYAREYASKTGRTEWSVRSRVRNLERKQQNTGVMQNGTR